MSVILLSPESNKTPLERRLFKVIQQFMYVSVHDDNSWGALFNTSKHKRRLAFKERLQVRMNKLVARIDKDAIRYQVKQIGSKRCVDIVQKRNQEYLIILQYKQIQ